MEPKRISGSGRNALSDGHRVQICETLKLEPITGEDYSLFESIFSDQKMMAELGGPLNLKQIQSLHARSMSSVVSGKSWHFKIVNASVSIGIVGIWEKQYKNAAVNEIGWMVLPGFQRRGFAAWGAGQIVSKAKAETRFKEIHAFPATTNVPSNVICEKLGFKRLEEVDFNYQGRSLVCYHWVLEF